MKVSSSSSTRRLVQAAFDEGSFKQQLMKVNSSSSTRRLVQAAFDEG
jgi:F420-dependent methylenetetrahydromethanopterin dehydrogenase